MTWPYTAPVTANVRINGKRVPFSFFGDTLTQTVCTEILDGSSYPIVQGKFKVKSIVDIGANVGATSLYFREHYPKALINAYEPFPPSFHLLCQNTAPFDINCHQAAVSRQKGQANLYPGRIGPVGFTLENDGESLDYLEVPTISATNIIKEFLPEILKIDVEGHEWVILGSVKPSNLAKISVIYVEYHWDHLRRKIDSHLEDHVLYHAQATGPHIGTLCYVKREFVTG